MINHSGAHEKRTQISLAFLIKQRQHKQQWGQGGSNSLAITCNYVEEGRAGGEGGHKNTDTRQINQPSRPQFINVAN